MPVYTIRHSPALHGEAQINTSKNAVLPILAAALLCSSPVTIHRAPRLTDVDHMLRVLTDCGARIERQDRDITIYPAALRQPREPQNLHSLRASILVLGPLCVRLGEAIVPLPGGCAIGQRPVDIHLNGLRAMGAETEQADNCAVARGRLRGANIYLDFPSVGATENLLMAAALADGVTRIENAAKEPEIVDLADFLNLAGAHIVGAGTGTLVIEGVSRLSGVEYTPIADRIEAGTLACAAAGASVVHVDAAKGMVQWARDNAKLSGLEGAPVRWIVDDCKKFLEREIRRGSRYDGIVMDPPSYGRGPGGEVWKLEESVYELCRLAAQVLAGDALFLLLNSYTTGLSASVMEYLLAVTAGARGGKTSSSEIGLPVAANGLVLPQGSTAIWER